jgi:hypothetical protein
MFLSPAFDVIRPKISILELRSNPFLQWEWGQNWFYTKMALFNSIFSQEASVPYDFIFSKP